MRSVWYLLVFSKMLVFSWAGAQTSSTVTPALPTFTANTTNVLVDVVVTDHRGMPVEGLTQSSFTVLENGQNQQIVSFETHPSLAPMNRAHVPAIPPGVYTNAPAVPADGTVDVLLIDALNTPTGSQAQAHRHLIEYLTTLPVNKSVAIFLLDTRLHQLEDFTTDHTALLQAVEEFSRSPQKSPLLKTPKETEAQMKDEDEVLSLAKAAGKPAMGKEMLLSLQQFNAEEDSFKTSLRVAATLTAFDQLAHYLAGVPGRKNLLWLSGSFPIAVQPDQDLKNPYDSVRDFSTDLEHTAGLLADARVAAYPIDVRGLFSQSSLAPSMSGGSAMRNPDRVIAAQSAETNQQAEEQMTLDEVAHATGGEAIRNTNDLKGALAELDRTGAHYYTLVYDPSDKSKDAKLRRIEVRVHPGDYHLSYRRTYFSAPTTRRDPDFLARMEHNTPASSQILFRLSPVRIAVQPEQAPLVGSNPNVRRPVTRFSIKYDVDVTPFALIASGDGVLHGSATLVVIAYDRTGKALNSVSNTFNLNVPAADYPRFLKQGLQYAQQLDIPTQAAWLRAGVMDHSSGLIGSLEVPVSVRLGETAEKP